MISDERIAAYGRYTMYSPGTFLEVVRRLRSAEEALKCCARPGTYHMTGLCQPCQLKVQDWGNYKARAHFEKLKKPEGESN